MTIARLNIPLVKPKIHDEELFRQRAHAAFECGDLTNNGPFLRQFEDEVSRYLGIPCVAVANGTLGMMLVLRSFNFPTERNEVILPSFTYWATAHAVSAAGLKPVFADIDLETYTLDPEEMRKAITPRTAAILAVHVFGNPCDVERLSAVAEEHKLPLIFDAAHAFGSLYQGKHIGHFGAAEIFSTHAVKTLQSVEGGIIATHDARILSYVQRARVFGMVSADDTDIIGINAKMSELHAIVGLDSLANIRETLARKSDIARWYRQYLGGLPGLHFQKIQTGAESSYFNFSILIEETAFGMDRNKLATLLEEQGIQTRKYFYLPVHRHTSYKEYRTTPLPHTDAVAEKVLCLPSHGNLSLGEVREVCGVIRSLAKKDNEHIFLPSPAANQDAPVIYSESNHNLLLRSAPLSQGIKAVLITGGGGYVGCVLVKKLLERGYAVRVLDQLIFGKEPLAEFLDHPLFDFHVGHVEDEYIVDKCLEGIEVVIHLAGLSNDPSCEINADLTRKANIDATKVLVDVAKKKRVRRFIYASSCSVYGFTGADEVNEDSPVNPLTAYAKSKVDCEKIIFPEASDSFTVVALRKATIYGPSPRMRFDLVLNTMTGMAVSENRITINGGNQWRPFVHIDDVAEAYLFILEAEKEKVNGQIYNVGSNEQNVTINHLAESIAALIPTAIIERLDAPDQRSYHVSFNKINALGWKAKRTIYDGVFQVKRMFDEGKIRDFRDLNYFNIRRMITYLNI